MDDNNSFYISHPRKNDIFICHASEDIEFVKSLDAAIRKHKRDPWVEWEDLLERTDPLNQEAERYIQLGIEDADVFVFVASLHSLSSEKNRAELCFASKCKKRLIPVLCHPDLQAKLPIELQGVTPLLHANSNLESSIVEQLAEEIVHICIYTRLLIRIEQWHQQNQINDFLLNKSDANAVEHWFHQNVTKEPGLSPAQKDFIRTSLKNNVQPPDLFISYARKDRTDFVENLCNSLKRNFKVWIDWYNIPVAADWRQEIKEGIASAHTFLFVISDHSAISKYCYDEIRQAVSLKKRIIPIVWRKPNEWWKKDDDPEAVELIIQSVKKPSWLFFENEEFEQVLSQLIEAIKNDSEYVKAYDRYLHQALVWEEHRKKQGVLGLIGGENLLKNNQLKKAKVWLSQARNKEPIPTPSQIEFIKASEYHQKGLRLLAAGLFTAITGILFAATFNVFTTTKEQVKALVNSLENTQGLDALMVSLQAAEASSRLNWLPELLKAESQVQVVTALSKSIYDLNEHNRLEEEHQEAVNNVIYSPDGTLIASASADGAVRLWKPDGTPGYRPLFHQNQKNVVRIVFSEDGQTLVSASSDGTVKVWQITKNKERLPKGTLLKTFVHNTRTQAEVYDVQLSSDGQYLASASIDGTIKVWKKPEAGWLTAGEPIVTLNHGSNNPVFSMSFSPDGKTIASASSDGVRLWTGKQFSQAKRLPNTEGDFGVSFSPNGQYLVSSGFLGTIKLWQSNGELIKELKGHEGRVHRAVFSHSSEFLASVGQDNAVRIWSVKDSRLLQTLRGHQAAVYRVQFSPDDRMVASAGADKTIKLWDRQQGRLLGSFEGHSKEILDISFSPEEDSETLASASADGSIRLWQTQNNNIQRLSHPNRVLDVVVSPDNQFVVSSSFANISFWSLEKGVLIRSIPTHKRNFESDIHSISLSHKGDLLAWIDDFGDVELWSLSWDSNRLIKLTPTSLVTPTSLMKVSAGQHIKASSISFSPDDELMASASNPFDNSLMASSRDPSDDDFAPTIKLWKIRPGNPIRLSLVDNLLGHRGAITSVSFSPDGHFLASGTQKISSARPNGEVILWSRNGKLLDKQEQFRGQALGDILNVSFSPDGKLLATTDSTNNSIKLWKLESNRQGKLKLVPFRSLEEHNDLVLKVSFSQDSQLLASASQDGTIKIWTREGKLITTLRKHNSGVSSVSFSRDEEILASASYDREVLLWKLPDDFQNTAKEQLENQGCQLLQEYLTTNESPDREKQDQKEQVKKFCEKISDSAK